MSTPERELVDVVSEAIAEAIVDAKGAVDRQLRDSGSHGRTKAQMLDDERARCFLRALRRVGFEVVER